MDAIEVTPSNRSFRQRVRVAAEWAIPAVVALIVLGPVLRPGVVFNLDLVLPPRLDTPAGFWGLGPELPRRLPMWAVIAWLSLVVPATIVGKVLMFGVIVAAWMGMVRLVERLAPTSSSLAAAGAGALYSLSPFILTRSLVGHFMVTVPHAVLPWVLLILLRPGRRLAPTYLACFALGMAGHFGGSVAVVVVVVGCVVGRLERPVARIAVSVAAQAAWLVPGLLVAATSPVDMAGTESFPTAARGFTGLARLSAGGGFWNGYFQVGGSGLLVSITGALLLVLAVFGTRSLPGDVRRTIATIGAVGWIVAAASALGGVSTVFRWIDDELLAGVWRDGQRMLVVHLVWLAPCTALGAERCSAWCRGRVRWRKFTASALMLPVAIACALATPAAWGFGGRLAADPLPASWREVRTAVRSEPGTVLVLPWYQYFNLSVGGGAVRRVLNPVPLFLGGDVLSSSDNGLGGGTDRPVEPGIQEVGDAREPTARTLVDRLARGVPMSADLASLGVRWVVILTTSLPDPGAGVRTDPSMEPTVLAADIALYRNERWVASALTPDGQPVSADSVGPAFARMSAHTEITWFRPGTGGWRRGWRAARIDERGVLVLPRGGGPVWNVATPFTLAAEIGSLIAVVTLSIRLSIRERRRDARDQGRSRTVFDLIESRRCPLGEGQHDLK